MYLGLAVFWFVAGVGLIVYDTYSGDSAWVLRGVGWSPGWLMLLFSAYNVVRWWGRRMSRSARDAAYHAWLERRYARNAPPVRREPPDPNFNFGDEPAQRPEGDPPA